MAAAEEATTHRPVGISSRMRRVGEQHAGFSRFLDEHTCERCVRVPHSLSALLREREGMDKPSTG